MMREKTIERHIREIIAKEMVVAPESITRETNLVNDLNADSMAVVNVVTSVESKFKITFPDDSEIQYNGYTLQFLIDGVVSALKTKPAASRQRRRVAEDAKG